jgi:iron complex transport system permease protein
VAVPTSRARPTTVDTVLRAPRARAVIVGLAAALLLTMAVAVCLGPVAVDPATVVQIIGHHVLDRPAAVAWDPAEDAIVWQVRVPRVLLGCVVGAALAMSGTALQAMVRNPLAEPYVLGVSGGAAAGAAAAILFGVGAVLGGQATGAVAFLGALGSMVLVLALARRGGGVDPGRMLLAGVAVGYLMTSVTSVLVLLDDSEQGARAVMFWLLGSLASADWVSLPVVSVVVVASGALLVWARRRLDLLGLGEESARSLGIDPHRTHRMLLVVVALCVGTAVATAGGIGFVGLVVPHLARRAVGVMHARLVPASALLGALLLVWADVAARLVLQPRELPIGVITGLVGAPLLIVLVRRLHLLDP